MTPEDILKALKGYQSDLEQIQSRFSHNASAILIHRDDDIRLKTIVKELVDLLRDHIPGSISHIEMITTAAVSGRLNYLGSPSYASVEDIRSVVNAVVTRVERNPALFELDKQTVGSDELRLTNALEQIVLRFHAVAVQLRERHGGRATLDVTDEYDVQDLLHALLRLYFADVRAEEWTPSYAGGSARTDFLLPEVFTVVETKMTRPGLTAKRLGEELIIDIARYRKHPQCRRLVCFVYDPEGRVANASGIENDLHSTDHGIEVRVFILPKHS